MLARRYYRRRLVLAALAASASAFAARPGSAADFGSRIERPTAQAGVDNTTSAIQTTYTWPTGSGNQLQFDYYIDSEQDWDFLKCFIDGSLAYSWSGFSRAGRITHPLTSGGSHTVRFEYVKDGSLSRGRDTAWVDNLTVIGANGVVAVDSFDARFPSLAAFSASGTGGGFHAALAPPRRVLRRPVQQAFSGTMGAGTTSRIERTINWPSATDNRLTFRYLVDSRGKLGFLPRGGGRYGALL